MPGSQTDSAAVLIANTGAAPTLVRAAGASAPVATAKGEQQFVVTGPAGASGVIVIAEGHLDVTDAPGGGTDLEPFESNMAAKFTEVPFIIGPNGTAVVTVTLTDSSPLEDPNNPGTFFTPTATGINTVTAYLTSGTTAGPVSAPIVLQLDGAVEVVPPTITDTTPDDDAADVARDGSVQVTFSEPMDDGTVLVDGAVVLTAGNDVSPIPAAVTANAEGTVFTLDPTADLAFDTEYTVTVAGTVTDVAGNAIAAPASFSFRTAKEVLPPPPPPPAPTNTGAPLCVTVPERPTNNQQGTIRLEASQLLISQRIAQAAVRRANAIERWLESGIVAGDLCGNAFGQADFTGMTYAGGGVPPRSGPSRASCRSPRARAAAAATSP